MILHVQTVKSSPKLFLILPDVPWVATATNKQLLEVAGGGSHSGGEGRQWGVGCPLVTGHRARPHPGPAGGRPHRLQQEDCQGPPEGRHGAGYNIQLETILTF